MKPHPQSSYSRPAGQPEFGKRVVRVKVSMSTQTEALAKLNADRQGVTLPEFIHEALIEKVHPANHGVIVHRVFLGRDK